MALRTVILLLALLGAVVVADEVVTSTVHVIDSANSSAVTVTDSLDDVAVVGREFFDADSDADVGEVELEDYEGESEADHDAERSDVKESEALSRSAHPLAHILTSRSSKRCWSTKSCKKFYYTKPGCCKKTCVNLASDNKNCGKCGKCCDSRKGYRCMAGKCRIPKSHGSAKPTTAAPCGKNNKCVTKEHTCCKGKCVNLMNNHGHCGKCGKGCDTKNGFHCKSGQCVHPTPPSPPPASECGDYKKCNLSGQSCCMGKCVSLLSDNENCGMCHKPCDTTKGNSCKSGKCVKNPTASQFGASKKCNPGQTCCDGKCVSLSSDCNSCGQCGKACDRKKGYWCKYGKCVKVTPPPSQCGKDKKCGSGETCCKGKCVNVKSNNGHCGKCDKGCGYASACCKGACKNVKDDDRNCGKCSKRCGYAQKCCDGHCIDVFGSNNTHCGACGKKCPTTCKFGMCGYGD